MKKILLLFVIIFSLVITLFADEKQDIVYKTIIKSPGEILFGAKKLSEYYNYTSNNLLNYFERWVSVYNIGIFYEKYDFFYFKDNRYVGDNPKDFNTVLISRAPLHNIYGSIYKFDKNNRLVMIGNIKYSGSNKKQNPTKLEDINIDYKLICNDEGYPSYTVSLGAWTTSFWKSDERPNSFFYGYEYNQEKITYDGRKQIKKLTKYRKYGEETKSVEYLSFYYDDLGRIKKIEEKTIGQEYFIDETFFYYLQNSVYYLTFTGSDEISISISSHNYDKYGYFKNIKYLYLSQNFKENKTFYNNMFNSIRDDEIRLEEEIKKLVDNEKSKIKDYFIYQNVNHRFKDSMKLQLIFLPDEELGNYIFGISGWYRYKYLNDIKN